MSLINQMLKDLDARHEVDARGRLHREIRALPAEAQNRSLRLAVIVLLLLTLAAGGWWAFERLSVAGAGHASVSPSVPAVPVQAPVAAAAVAPEALSATATTTVATPAAEPALAAADVAANVALDEVSGLKLAAMLDKLPAMPPPVSKPLLPSPARDPVANPPVAAVAPTETPLAVKPAKAEKAAKAEAPAKVAPGTIEKHASGGKTSREKAEADYRRAVALVNGARISEATDAALDALHQDGGHVPSRQLLARLLIEQRRYDEAMAILAEGLAALPGQLGWAMTLARLQVERNDLAGAARILQASLQYASANADYLGFAGLVQQRLGHAKESAAFYHGAASVSPTEGRWWLGLGLALEADNRAAEAREAFLRARASGTLNPELAAIADQKLR